MRVKALADLGRYAHLLKSPPSPALILLDMVRAQAALTRVADSVLFLLPRSVLDVATDRGDARAGTLLASLEQAVPVAHSLGHQKADACRFLAILADL